MEQNPGGIGPNESRDFTYVGEMIPNQVSIQNLSPDQEAQFFMQGINDDVAGWKYFGAVPAGQTISVLVSWPGEGRVTNRGDSNASINVFGDGIFPKS